MLGDIADGLLCCWVCCSSVFSVVSVEVLTGGTDLTWPGRAAGLLGCLFGPRLPGRPGRLCPPCPGRVLVLLGGLRPRGFRLVGELLSDAVLVLVGELAGGSSSVVGADRVLGALCCSFGIS